MQIFYIFDTSNHRELHAISFIPSVLNKSLVTLYKLMLTLKGPQVSEDIVIVSLHHMGLWFEIPRLYLANNQYISRSWNNHVSYHDGTSMGDRKASDIVKSK